MTVVDLARNVAAWFDNVAVDPVARFVGSMGEGERLVLYVLLATAAALGFLMGRRQSTRVRRRRWFAGWRFSSFQNDGEALVSRALLSRFGPPDYHLMNHVTLRMEDGTTQIDHILVSRFGVFVIETKDHSGWLFGRATDANWTQVLCRRKSTFQNPIFQNARHVRAVQELLDFLPPEAVKSVVVFSGDAEFKTEVPQGVMSIDQLIEYLRQQSDVVMSTNRLQFCVGRLETARLAISRATDVEHAESLARRHVGRSVRRRP
jgi:hypothetical protein